MSTTRSRRRLVATTAIVSLVAFTGCGDDDDPPSEATPDALDGRTFTSTEVEGYSLVDGTEITLAFDGDSIAVNAGCNGMNGGYSIEDGTLTAADLASTMMACEEPLMRQDEWLAAFLAGGAAASLDGDALTLAAEDVTITATASER